MVSALTFLASTLVYVSSRLTLNGCGEAEVIKFRPPEGIAVLGKVLEKVYLTKECSRKKTPILTFLSTTVLEINHSLFWLVVFAKS